MAQVEAKMTVKKAIAIWKYKSGTHGINEILDNNYRDVALLRFCLTLKKQVKNNKMLTFMALMEHSSYKKAVAEK